MINVKTIREERKLGNSNMMSNIAKSFDILETSLSVLHNHFNGPAKYFQICIQILRYFNKIVFSVYIYVICKKIS